MLAELFKYLLSAECGLKYGGFMMQTENAVVCIWLDDISCKDIFQNAILENERGLQENMLAFDVFADNNSRTIVNNDWLMFSIMLIPAVASAVEIAELIKGKIKTKVTNKLQDANIKKRVCTRIRITLPFFSYDREEEMIIDTTRP